MWTGCNRPAEDTRLRLVESQDLLESMVSFGTPGGVVRENRCGGSLIEHLFTSSGRKGSSCRRRGGLEGRDTGQE